MVAAAIGSLKVTVTAVPVLTPVAPLFGETEITVGGVSLPLASRAIC